MWVSVAPKVVSALSLYPDSWFAYPAASTFSSCSLDVSLSTSASNKTTTTEAASGGKGPYI